ncbi:MAG: flagellar hook-length control protein FliK [Fimbriimonadaceae bacterium]|nr:MAG: flagellar hook-length control protein FliK [Fimbriimonadaceae bacterium]
MNPISLNLGPVAAHPSGAAGRIQSEPNGKRRNDKAHPPPGGLGPPGAASRTGGEARDRGPIAPSKQPDSEPQNPAKPANADAETAPSKLQASTAEAEVPLAAPSWGVPENFQSLVVSVMGGTQPIIAEPAAAPIPDSLRAEATAGTVPSVAQAGSVSIPGFVLGDRAGDAAQPGEAQAAELPVEDALAAELVPGPLIQGSSGSESQSVAEVPEPILSQIFDSTQLGSDSSGNAAQTPQQVAKAPAKASEAAEVASAAPLVEGEGAAAQIASRETAPDRPNDEATAAPSDSVGTQPESFTGGEGSVGAETPSGQGASLKAEPASGDAAGAEAQPLDAIRAASVQTTPLTRVRSEPSELTSLSADVRNRVVAQVADHIESILAVRPRNGVVLRLEPHDLGVVEIGLKATEGGVEAKLAASHASVHAALEQSKAQLGAALEAKGLTLVALTIESQSDLGSQTHQQAQPDSGQPQNASLRGQGLHRASEPGTNLTFYDARRQSAGVDIWI